MATNAPYGFDLFWSEKRYFNHFCLKLDNVFCTLGIVSKRNYFFPLTSGNLKLFLECLRKRKPFLVSLCDWRTKRGRRGSRIRVQSVIVGTKTQRSRFALKLDFRPSLPFLRLPRRLVSGTCLVPRRLSAKNKKQINKQKRKQWALKRGREREGNPSFLFPWSLALRARHQSFVVREAPEEEAALRLIPENW